MKMPGVLVALSCSAGVGLTALGGAAAYSHYRQVPTAAVVPIDSPTSLT